MRASRRRKPDESRGSRPVWRERGGEVPPRHPTVRVNPAYTSQRCNECGHTAKENRESQAVFLCQRCEHTDHADTNAAKNILDDALIKAAVEEAARTVAGAGSKDETEARKDLDPGLAAPAMNRKPPNVMSHGGLGIPIL